MNDAIADPEGRFFAGSNFYDPDHEYELGKLFRVDADGTAHVADEGFELANGLAFSTDAKRCISRTPWPAESTPTTMIGVPVIFATGEF